MIQETFDTVGVVIIYAELKFQQFTTNSVLEWQLLRLCLVQGEIERVIDYLCLRFPSRVSRSPIGRLPGTG